MVEAAVAARVAAFETFMAERLHGAELLERPTELSFRYRVGR